MAKVKAEKWNTKKMALRFAEIHKKRMDRFRRDTAEMHKAVLEQARTHALETNLHVGEIVELQEHVRTLLSLVNVARRNEWTPACDSDLYRVRKAIRNGHN